MSPQELLLKSRLSARCFWVDLAHGIRLRVECMTRKDRGRLWREVGDLSPEEKAVAIATDRARGWEGMREEHMLSDGGSEAVAFDAALLADYLSEHMDQAMAVTVAISERFVADLSRMESEQKN